MDWIDVQLQKERGPNGVEVRTSVGNLLFDLYMF